MKRVGTKNTPVFRIVVTDGRSPRDGKFIEAFGSYDPTATPHKLQIDDIRLKHWLGVGAQPTETVAQLIKEHKKAQPAPAKA